MWTTMFRKTVNVCVLTALFGLFSCGSYAQEEPEAAKTEETEQVKPIDTSKGFVKLQLPAVADRIGLSDAQRGEVQRLMNELPQKLKDIPKEDVAAQNTVRLEYEDKLANILTPEQKRIWPKVFEEKNIVFVFKGQTWAQVLNWFADQLGMQLAMDAPPPGTFDFSSQDGYSPKEALDLINGRLYAKGYTLVTKDRTLMLFNLTRKEQLTAEYLPRVNEKNLDEHGTFEFVAYTLPLEYRDVNIVLETIKPFSGLYNKVIRMPGNSLMVIDTVGNIKIIDAMAKSVHNPIPKKEAAPKPPPPKPESEWKNYVIEKNDPGKIEEIISNFVGAKGLKVENTLYYLVPESQHGNIRTIVDMLERGEEDRPKPTLETYSMEGLVDTSPQRLWYQARMSAYGMYTDPSANFGEAIIETIKKMAPDAVVESNQISNRIIVFATPVDHEKIKDFFKKLQSGPAPELAPIVKIYAMKNPQRSMRMSEEVAEVMKNLVPTAQFTFDERRGQLYVVAIARDHDTIAQALDAIEEQTLTDEDKILVMYPVTAPQAARFSLLFSQVRREPGLRDVIELSDGRQNQLTIWATSKQHEKVRGILNEIANLGNEGGTTVEIDPETNLPVASAKRTMELASIPLKNARAYTIMTVVGNMVPGAEVSYDPPSNSIIVYGTASIVENVRKAVEKLDSGLDQDVLFFPLTKEIPSEITDSFDRVAPRAFVVFDKKNMRLMVYGPKNEVAEIEKILNATFASNTDSPETMQTVSVTRDLPNDLVDFVRKVFPRAQINFNRDAKLVTVIAPENEQLNIAKQIIESERSLPPDEETKFYTLEQPITDNLLTLIRESVKSIGSIGDLKRDDKNPKLLVVRARPNIQAEIVKLINDTKMLELSSVAPNELRSFPITQETRKRFDAVRDDFIKQNGDFKVLNEDRKDVISVWATPTQIELLDELFTQLAKEMSPEQSEKRIIHSLKYIDLETVRGLLNDIYPGTKIVEDSNNDRIIVRVRPEFYDGAKELIEQLDTKDPDAVKRYFKPYDINGLYTTDGQGRYYNPTYFIADLEKLAPRAKISFDRYSQQVIVWGTDEDHKTIEEAIGNLQKDGDKIKGFEKYPLRRADYWIIIGMIRQLYPLLEPRYDYGTHSIIVQGGANHLKLVGALIDKLDPAEPGPTDPVIKFYKLTAKPDTTLVSTLKSLVSGTVQIVPDEDAKQLMVIAKPDEHAIIAHNIKSIFESFTQPEDPILVVYPVIGDQRKRLKAFIETAKADLKEIKELDDETPGQISIYARPAEHEVVAAVLMKMQTTSGDDMGLKLRVFPLSVIDPQTATDVINQTQPEAKLIPDNQLSRILVYATEANLQKVADLLQEIDSPIVDETQQRFDSYNVDSLRSETLEYRYIAYHSISLYLAKQLPNARIFPGSDFKKVIIWGTPKELEIARKGLEQIGYTDSPENRPEAKIYEVKRIDPEKIIDDVLKPSAPDAVITLDATSKKIIVFARKDDMQAIDTIINALEQTDMDRQEFIAYTITGTKAETVLESIKEMYPGLKIAADEKTNRLNVWATPEEHVKIGTVVREVNKEIEGENAEGFDSYPITRVFYSTALEMIKEMFPDASVYADEYSDRITVKALVRDRNEIGKLLEKMQSKDNDFRVKLAIYPIGEADPITIEVLLQSLLKFGKSLTPLDIRMQIQGNRRGQYNPYGEYDMYDQYAYQDPIARYNRDGRAYYRVDAKMKTAIVVATEEDQKRVSEGIEQLAVLGAAAGKLESRFYSMNEVPYYSVVPVLQQIAPSTQFLPGGNSRDFVALGIQSDLEQIDQFVKEINQSGPSGNRREMIVVTTAEGTRVDRSRIVQMLRYMYDESYPTLGPEANQVVLWARRHQKDEIQSLVEEVSRPLPEDKQSTYKSYDINYIAPQDAIRWLGTICPNAEIEINTASRDPVTGGLLPRRTIVVLATPIEHVEIAKALSELDKDLPDNEKPLAKLYTLRELVAYNYFSIMRNITPTARFSYGDNNRDFIAYASMSDHEKIKAFVDDLNEEGPSESRRLYDVISIPQGSKHPRLQVVRMLASTFPQLYPTPGPEPNQIVVLGRKYQIDQAREFVEKACSLLPEDQQTSPKYYSLKNIPSLSAVAWLQQFVPNAQISQDSRSDPTHGGGIVVIATPFEHELVAKTLAELDIDVSDEMRPVAKYYSLDGIASSAYYSVYSAIRYSFEDIIAMSPAPERMMVMVVAREDVQTRVEEFIKKHLDEMQSTEPYLETYGLTKLNFFSVLKILKQMFPTVPMYEGTTTDSLYVYATPRDQQTITETLQKLEKAAFLKAERDAAGTSPLLKVYKIASKSASTYYDILGYQFPQSIIFPISDVEIVAWASPEEHEQIARVVGAIAEAYPDPTIKPYFFKHLPPQEAYSILASMFSPTEAQFVPRVNPTDGTVDIVVQATEEVHTRIAKFVDQIDVPRPEGTDKFAQAYDLSEFPATFIYPYIVPHLVAAVPTCVILPNTLPTQIVVFCRKVEHEKIAQVINEMKKSNPLTQLRTLPYTIKTATAASVYPLLLQMYPNAQFGFGTDKHKLIVLANLRDHEKIQDTIEKINLEDPDRAIPKPYRFQRAEIGSAYAVVMSMFPAVEISYDRLGDMLLIRATPEEHVEIAEVIKEIDTEDPLTQTTLEIHNTGSVNAANLALALRALYTTSTTVNSRFRISFDVNNKTITAVATPQQQKYIRELIKKIQSGGMADPTLALKIFSLYNYNPYTVQFMIRDMFEDKGLDIDLSYDSASANLLVYARPDEIELIEDLLSKLKTPERLLQIFMLDVVDPDSLSDLSYDLFYDIPYSLRPSIRADYQNNAVIVRGSIQHIQRIRDLLIEMGEAKLKNLPIKPLPTSDDVSQSPTEISPPDTTNLGGLGNLANPDNQMVSDTATYDPDGVGVLSGEDKKIRTIKIDQGNVDEILGELGKQWENKSNVLIIRKQEKPQDATDKDMPNNDSTEEKENETINKSGRLEDAAFPFGDESGELYFQIAPERPQESDESKTETTAPYIYLVQNEDGTLTLMSEDTEALNEVEANMKMLLQKKQPSRIMFEDRYSTMYAVRNISAQTVLMRLNVILRDKLAVAPRQPQQMYPTYPTSQRRRTLVLAVEPSMDAIIARGSKLEREEVGKWIEVLDRSQVGEATAPQEPLNVEIENTQASEIIQQVLQVFQRQIAMTTMPGGGRPQILLSRSGNSIDIYAPEPLLGQIRDYAKKRDEIIAKQKTEKIHVFRPEQTNSKALNQAIMSIQQSSLRKYYLSNPAVYNPYPNYSPTGGYYPGTYPGGYRGY